MDSATIEAEWRRRLKRAPVGSGAFPQHLRTLNFHTVLTLGQWNGLHLNHYIYFLEGNESSKASLCYLKKFSMFNLTIVTVV